MDTYWDRFWNELNENKGPDAPQIGGPELLEAYHVWLLDEGGFMGPDKRIYLHAQITRRNKLISEMASVLACDADEHLK